MSLNSGLLLWVTL